MITKDDLAPGFRVGTFHISGSCEHCGVPLHRGDRVALWNPTRELFCLKCAKQGVRPEPPLSAALVIPAVTVLLLMLTIIIGFAD